MQWEEIEVPAKGALFSVWGSSPTDIWAGGNLGTLFHYNGSQWNIDSLPHPKYPDFEYSLNISEINGFSSNLMYIYSYTVFPGGSDLNHFFSYEKGHISLQDSTWEHVYEMWVSPSGNLYKAAIEGFYLWTGNNWQKVSDFFQTYGIRGTSDKNIFIAGESLGKSRVMHYNGSDWYEYEALQTDIIFYRDVFTIDNEVFVCGYTKGGWPSKTVIWHGK